MCLSHSGSYHVPWMGSICSDGRQMFCIVIVTVVASHRDVFAVFTVVLKSVIPMKNKVLHSELLWRGLWRQSVTWLQSASLGGTELRSAALYLPSISEIVLGRSWKRNPQAWQSLTEFSQPRAHPLHRLRSRCSRLSSLAGLLDKKTPSCTSTIMS